MISFDNLNSLIRRETMKSLQETLGGFMNDDDQSESERKRQKHQADAINHRGLKGGASTTEVDEADDEESEGEESEEGREDRTGGKGTADSHKLKTPSEKKLKNVTIGSVVDKLNALRGGRSLKDPQVQKSFKQYFGSLTGSEKQSMLVFLTGIAQILAGTKSGAEAIDPGDVGLRVKGKSKPLSSEKEDKPEDQKQGSKKDQPIVVGEHARVNIRRAIEAYKKNAK
jgi:hypothetical protein